MKSIGSFLERKKAALCILAGICAVSLFVMHNSINKVNEKTGGSYVVKIKHYGLDALEMERSVTIPLEDALSAVSGVMTVQSSSENSLSRIFIRFRRGGKGTYEAVRDAAQRVYETLPSSAQRPEILSSNNSRVPVWSASVTAEDGDSFSAAQILEKIVKPRFESLEGAGEVIVSGAGLNEIVIALDQEKLDVLGLEPAAVGAALGRNDSIFSGGSIKQGNREIVVTVDGRDSLNRALIPLGDGRFVELSQIALVTEQERQPDILSRLNGKKTAGIAVMGRNDADLRRLSNEIKKEIASLEKDLSLPFKFTVLSDLGAQEAAAFRSVFNAALLGAIMVALISFLLKGKKASNRSGYFCALSIPFICLVSAAVLSTAGFSVNRLMLAGIAAGIGTAVDAVILVSERLRKCVDYNAARAALSDLASPLLAGAATTVAALIPLFAIEDGGVRVIANAIAIVCLTAFVMSLTLLPPLLLWGLDRSSARPQPGLLSKLSTVFAQVKRRLSRVLCRVLAADIGFCIRRPLAVTAIALALSAAAVFALFTKGVDTSGYGSEDSVYAQVEFEGGLLAEEADRLLAAYGEKLASCAGIKNVETGARTGSGSLLISFDPKLTRAQTVREIAKNIPIPGGFVFFQENSNKDRYWEIKIYGDEDQKCRELAEELAYLCASHPLIRERVLNFKQGSKKLLLLPDREIIAAGGAESKAGFASAASRARLGVYGPVAYKKMNADGEIDVRIRTGGIKPPDREETLSILTGGGLRLSSLMKTKEEVEPSSIRRDDRRRTASITVSTAPMDPRRVRREIGEVIKKIDFPPGYSAEFDPDAIRQAKALSATVLSLVLAVIFCYMIIASINESFIVPLLILCAIPPSLAVPALCLALSGSAYNSAVACAFIAVSGMTVNAAVLCVDGLRKNPGVYSALRRKMPVLLATTATTVAGALPFLFLTEGANTLIRTLSLTGALGVACSCICSVTVIPALFTILKNFIKPYSGTHKI
jgi:multidrug efflux pump subunit AcrB